MEMMSSEIQAGTSPSDEASREEKDRFLFNRIARQYARKDWARSTSLVRKSDTVSSIQPLIADVPSF